jgi:hypothetical protein
MQIPEKLSIAAAMPLRNKIKSVAIKYVALFSRVEKTREKGTAATYTSTGGKKPDDILTGCLEIENELFELNKRIDDANSKGGKTLLLEINHIRDLLMIFENALEEARRLKPFVKRELTYDERQHGATAPVNVEMDIDLDVAKLEAEVKDLENKKFELETLLRDFNAKTKVDLGDGLNTRLEVVLNM